MNQVILVIVILLAGTGAVSPASAITIGFSPTASVADQGSQLSVDVVVDLGGLPPPAIGTFDIDVSFNPTLLGFSNVVFGPFLGDEAVGEAITASGIIGPGLLDLFEISLLASADLIVLQPSSFALATITFDAIAPGPSVLAVSVQAVGDEEGNPLAVTTVDGSVAISPVLAVTGPGSVVLLLSGVAAVGALLHMRTRWRRS